MSGRRKRLTILGAATLGIVTLIGYSGRSLLPSQQTKNTEVSEATSVQCSSCHPEIHRDYQHVGMARSFAAASQMQPKEFGPAATFFHATSGRYFETIIRDGRFWQRRYELDAAGRQTNAFELEATHRIGSGNHARSFLHRSASGEMIQLPLTWYTQEQAWGMSPGYDNARPPDFTRIVDESCLFCHNGYPREGELAQGIDCQRCHGSGNEHVQLVSRGSSSAAIKAAIVNPKRLSAERQMDICMQCHLETTSAELPQMIRRFERAPFSYRPGELLGAYMVHFDQAQGNTRDRFEIVNQAYRLRQSACFLKSNGRLTCTTCHNPHFIPRGEDAISYNRTKCLQCHPTVKQANHVALATSNCATCHMPKRRAEDAVHVVMTDHLIQRKPLVHDATLPLKETARPYRGPLTVYYPLDLSPAERDTYVGVASIAGSADRERGIELLERALTMHPPPKALAVLGEGYLAEGKFALAIDVFQKAVTSDPSLEKAHYNLGRALELSGRPQEAQQAFEASLQVKAFPEAEYALANVLLSLGDRTNAQRRYQNAIRLRPTYAEAHANLGNLYASEGRLQDAFGELQQAVKIDPAYPDARNNLARVLASLNRLPEAIAECRKAIALKPDYAEARYNLARLLHETGATAAALAEYRNLIAHNPKMIEARLGYGQALGDAGRLQAAIAEFREVLRLLPGHPEAQKNLAMALDLQRTGGGH